MADDKKTDDNDTKTLGLVFLITGASMCVTFGIVFGPAFAASGLAFIILGLMWMGKQKSDDNTSEDEG